MLLYVPHRRRAKYWGMRDGKDEIQSLFFLFLILKHMGLTFQIHTAILLPVLLHPLLRPAVSWLLPSSSASPGSYRRGDAAFIMGWALLILPQREQREKFPLLSLHHIFTKLTETQHFLLFKIHAFQSYGRLGQVRKKKKRTKWLTRCSHKVCFTTS